MLEIDSSRLVGKGLHRECFVHPDNPDLCVKVVVAGNSDENRRESKYYGLLARRGISWEMLTRFHGLVETSLGQGAVFDLVRDYEGDVSQTLAHYLDSQQLTDLYGRSLAAAFKALRAYLLENRVITMTLKTKNILFQRLSQGSGKLVVVDNVGNSDFIPLTNYIACLARRKIERKWRQFEQDIRSQNASNKALTVLLTELKR